MICSFGSSRGISKNMTSFIPSFLMTNRRLTHGFCQSNFAHGHLATKLPLAGVFQGDSRDMPISGFSMSLLSVNLILSSEQLFWKHVLCVSLVFVGVIITGCWRSDECYIKYYSAVRLKASEFMGAVDTLCSCLKNNFTPAQWITSLQ